jgi:hypothetical protein
MELDGAKLAASYQSLENVSNWSNTGARFHDVVTRKLTVVLFQPMPGLEELDRKRLLPVWVFAGRRNTGSSVPFLCRQKLQAPHQLRLGTRLAKSESIADRYRKKLEFCKAWMVMG